MAGNNTMTNKRYDEVPAMVKGYPPPAPSTVKVDEIYDISEYTNIDEKARRVPEEKLKDFHTLVSHLTANLTTDVQKVRAIFVWLGHQNVDEMVFSETTDLNTPKGRLKHIKESHFNYRLLFTILCREAGIPCVMLSGHCKAGTYEVGSRDLGNSGWNAVYAGGGWRLVHCLWAFMSLVGQVSGNWLKIEQDGKGVREEAKQSEGTSQKSASIREQYFFIRPEVMINLCMPKNAKWQLLEKPLSLERFMDAPFISSKFPESGFTFKRGQKGVIETKNGVCTAVIKALGQWRGDLSYELSYKLNDLHTFPESSGADRYVYMINKDRKQEIKFKVKCPVEGEYKLSLYEIKKRVSTRICDFKIMCEERQHQCVQLPVAPKIGWGPGPAADKAGLYDISHDDGWINANEDVVTDISFRTKLTPKINVHLKHAELSDNMIKQFVNTTQRKNMVHIKVTADVGEYALLIYSGATNILNYIIESGQIARRAKNKRENVTERNVRLSLKEATKNRKKEDILAYVERFKRLRMEDKGDLSKANEALLILEVKQDLKSAILRNRVDELQKAIDNAKSCEVASKVRKKIAEAERVLGNLQDKKMTPRPSSAMNNSDLAELGSVQKLRPPLRDIVTAVFLLLGENQWTLEDTGHMLRLIRQKGNKGLLSRISNFHAKDVSVTAVRRAKTLLDQHSEERLARINPSAGKLYKEGVKLLELCQAVRKSVTTQATKSSEYSMPDINNAQGEDED